MSTNAPAALTQFAKDWKALYPSAVISGIVGDVAHQAAGGYHISREDNPAGNYSIVRPDDQYGPADMASAVDMNLNDAEMKRCSTRLVAAFSNADDPRRKYINAFNGTIDGTSARRWDVYARTVKAATSDHLWHVHLEVRRRYCNSTVATKAILSILNGEGTAGYLRSVGVTATPAAMRTHVAPPFPGVLKRNDRATKPNPNVRRFQVQLRARGWTSQGSSDGYFGARMETTVKRWQRSAGLPVDGIIGPRTWSSLWSRRLAA